MSRWESIQKGIWDCRECQGDHRVRVLIRQQTELQCSITKLLIVSLAPPFIEDISIKIQAPSVTNNPDDGLRLFVEEVLALPWDTLAERGLKVLHAVKCAIVPVEGGFQNPPPKVVDLCAPRHLASEFRELSPSVVVTLGRMAYRALFHALQTIPGFQKTKNFKLSKGPSEALPDGPGYLLHLDHSTSMMFTSRFPRGSGRVEASHLIKRAAKLSRVIDPN